MLRTRQRAWLMGVVTAAFLSLSPATFAQSSGPDASMDRPIAGTWVVTDDGEPDAVPSTTVAHADGTVVFFRDDGPFAGVWESTGDDTAIVTLVATRPEGVIKLRADVTVAPDGETFTGSYTVEPSCMCGDSLGEFGPGSVTGTRIHAEAPGEPVGSLDDLEPSTSPLPSAEPGPSPAPSAS